MHELGIMTTIISTVCESANAAGATAVTKIDLSVGEMVEAIDEAMQFAFEALQELPENSICANAELCITKIYPRSLCLECGLEYDHDRFHMLCPDCGSPLTELLQGRELQIESIEVDMPDE